MKNILPTYSQLLRYLKLSFIIYAAIFFTIVAFGNIFSYQVNWPAVQHILAMDTVHISAAKWRAITSRPIQIIVYILIVSWETLTACVLWRGAWQLWKNRQQESARFQPAKRLSLLGIAMAIALYFFGFCCIASEWFQMWQSSTYNAQPTAMQFSLLFFLLFLILSATE